MHVCCFCFHLFCLFLVIVIALPLFHIVLAAATAEYSKGLILPRCESENVLRKMTVGTKIASRANSLSIGAPVFSNITSGLWCVWGCVDMCVCGGVCGYVWVWGGVWVCVCVCMQVHVLLTCVCVCLRMVGR